MLWKDFIDSLGEYDERTPIISFDCYRTPDTDDTIKFIGNHYGDKQWDKLEEELEEFKAALADYKVSKNVDSMAKYQAQARFKVIEEFADVMIVMHSILSIKGNEDMVDILETIRNYKVSRQLYRILNDDPKAGDPNYGN